MDHKMIRYRLQDIFNILYQNLQPNKINFQMDSPRSSTISHRYQKSINYSLYVPPQINDPNGSLHNDPINHTPDGLLKRAVSTNGSDGKTQEQKQKTYLWWTLIIIVVLVILSIGGCIILYIRLKNRNDKKLAQYENKSTYDWIGDKKLCKQGTFLQNGKCYTCPSNYVWNGSNCLISGQYFSKLLSSRKLSVFDGSRGEEKGEIVGSYYKSLDELTVSSILNRLRQDEKR